MKCIIVCGGKASRMKPLSEHLPKDLMPIFDQPVIAHIVNDALEAGLQKIVVSTTPEKSHMFRKHLVRSELEKTVEIISEPDAGVAYRIFSILPFINGDKYFAVNYGDTIGETNLFKNTISRFDRLKSKSSFVLLKTANVERFAAARFAEDGTIVEIVEKPNKSNAPSNICAMANYILDADAFFRNGRNGFRYDQRYPLQFVLENGGEVKGYLHKRNLVDIGTPPDILTACKLLIKRKLGSEKIVLSFLEEPFELRGKVYVGKNCEIGRSSTLIDAFVNSGTVLGNGVRLQNVYVMGSSKICNGSLIRNSIIFKKSLIPENTILDGKIVIANNIYDLVV